MIVIPKEIELKNDTYYFECCAGLGDTMLICGYMNALLDKYQAQVRLIVKPSHAFIPKFLGAWQRINRRFCPEKYTLQAAEGKDICSPSM